MSKEKRRVPKLRFPGFTEDWEQCKLKSIANTIVAGGDIDKNKINRLVFTNKESLRLRENLPKQTKKEINRALNHESNKYLTGESLGKQCKSAYENYSGGKRLKKETDNMVYPKDMPKYIKTNL